MLWVGSMSGSSEIFANPPAEDDCDANAVSKLGDAPRSRYWNPPTPARLSPMRALLCTASIATPQLVQSPPVKLIVSDPALFIVVTVGLEPPGIRYTSVLFAVQTVIGGFETGFEAQE